jgi:hypothetical protein
VNVEITQVIRELDLRGLGLRPENPSAAGCSQLRVSSLPR